MNATVVAWVVSLSFAVAGWLPSAPADTTDGTCDVIQDGDAAPEASRACTVSQRDGHVRIRLQDGRSFVFLPGGEPDHFHDKSGNHVTHKTNGDHHEYAWKGKKIVVTFAKV